MDVEVKSFVAYEASSECHQFAKLNAKSIACLAMLE